MPVLYMNFSAEALPLQPTVPCPRPVVLEVLGISSSTWKSRGSLGGFELPNEDSCVFREMEIETAGSFNPRNVSNVNLKPPKLDVLDINPACLLLM
jgi:hypothetical protein